MERLNNCPNCGGWLEDSGRCRFCGSKIYDFCDVDLDSHCPKYIRIKVDNRIITTKMIIDAINFQMSNYECPNGSIDFRCIGDITMEVEQ